MPKKIIALQGIPASGKSARACELLTEYGNAVRINRDLLRTMLHNNVWSGAKEDITFASAKAIVKALLSEKNVGVILIDDTNLNPKVLASWKQLAKDCDADFEVLRMDTPIDECLRRDAARAKPVWHHVIVGMAMQWGLYPIPDAGFVICDIDGTLADITHRRHYVQQEPKDWTAFFEAAWEDRLRLDVEYKLCAHINAGREIILVSGRPDTYRLLTEEWLTAHRIKYTTLFMRRAHDHRPDTIVKEEILKAYFPDKSDIVEAIDDRPSILRLWESYGIKTVDVGNGEEF